MPDLKISQLTAAGTLHPNAIVPVVQPDPNNGGALKNFSVKASQFNTGAQLLGRLIGTNMNLASLVTLKYNGLSGYPFQVGDTVKDNATGATATVVSDTGTVLVLSGVSTTNTGGFNPGDVISGTVGQVTYSSASGSFEGSSGGFNRSMTPSGTPVTVYDETSGATFGILTDSGSVMTTTGINGTLTMGDTIRSKETNATAVISAYTPPATAKVSSYNVSDGDQPIPLSGGSTYIVTDIVLTNANTTPTNAADGQVWTGASRSGFEIAFVSIELNLLTLSSVFFNRDNGIVFNIASTNSNIGTGISSVPPVVTYTNTSPIYFSLGTPQGSSATADIYVYGYILN